MKKKEIVWNDDKSGLIEGDRKLGLYRPCSCGTCRPHNNGVGYISGAVDGEGVTLWIKDEEVYRRIANLFEKNNLEVRMAK